MRRHWKTHLVAITAIVSLIVVLFLWLGPKPPKKAVIGDVFVQIYTATWGSNCSDAIDNLNHQILAAPPVHKDDTGATPADAAATGLPDKPLPPVAHDNVLEALSAKCNNQLSCTVMVDSATLGVEPIASCYKHLTVGYRCFAIDKLNMLEFSQGDTLSIDCTNAGTPTDANGSAPANH